MKSFILHELEEALRHGIIPSHMHGFFAKSSDNACRRAAAASTANPRDSIARKSILSNNPFKLSDLFLWNATTVSGKKNTTIRSMNKDRGRIVIHIALGAVGGRVYRLLFPGGWTLWTPNQRKLRCLRREFRNPITTLSSSRTHHNLTKTPNMIDSRFTMNTCRWKKVQFLRLSTTRK
jgi:hypothetical protein